MTCVHSQWEHLLLSANRWRLLFWPTDWLPETYCQLQLAPFRAISSFASIELPSYSRPVLGLGLQAVRCAAALVIGSGTVRSVCSRFLYHRRRRRCLTGALTLPNDCLIIVALVSCLPWLSLSTRTRLYAACRDKKQKERKEENDNKVHWKQRIASILSTKKQSCASAPQTLLDQSMPGGKCSLALRTTSHSARRLDWTFGRVAVACVSLTLLVRLKFILLKIDLKKFDLETCF